MCIFWTLMTRPRITLPSTTMLRVFEASTRTLSFTRAADELFLTQSAVSKQVKALEDQLGRTLFIRINRGLVLTPAGQAYYRDIAPLMLELERATEKVMDCAGSSKLTLHVFPTLGEKWLLERFTNFAQTHPHIEVVFTAMLSSDGFKQLELDGDFKFGNGLWPGHESDYLFGTEMALVASPLLLAQRGGLTSAIDVLRYPWLQHFQVPHVWDELIHANPTLRAAVETGRVPQAAMYEFYNVLIRAAVSGLGLAVVPRIWVRQEIASGQLVNPLGLRVKSRYGYYFVVPEHKAELASVAAFRKWLSQEAQQTQTELLSLPNPAFDAAC